MKYTPSFREYGLLLLVLVCASLLVYAGIKGSAHMWFALEEGKLVPVVRIDWVYRLGLCAIALAVILAGMEFLMRTVTVTDSLVKSASPLRLCRQKAATGDIEAVRTARGFCELRVKGRWIIFLANSRFRKEALPGLSPDPVKPA